MIIGNLSICTNERYIMKVTTTKYEFYPIIVTIVL